jgi:hypothetical protein
MATKTRTPAGRERPPDQTMSKWGLEFWGHVAVGWHVAVDFETNAYFNQNGCGPGHSILPLDLGKNNRAKEHGIASTPVADDCGAYRLPYGVC